MNGPVVRLKDLCSLITKGTTPTSIGFDFSDGGVGFLRVQNVSGGRVNFQNGTLFIEESVHQELRRSQILPGDILLSIAGTIGRTGVVPENAPSLNCNQALAIIRPEDKVFRPFLRHWLESANAQSQMRGATVTGTIQNLSLAQVGSLQVPLPPLPAQHRIAAILDQADALRAKRREAVAQLDSLTQSIFIEMFGELSTNSKGWKTCTVGDVSGCIVPGRDKPKSFSGNTPWVTTADLKHLELTPGSSKRIGLSDKEIRDVRARVIPSGSVIISCVGDLGVVSIAEIPMVVNQQLHSFQCHSNFNNIFLMYCLALQKPFMLAKASSTTLPYMNKTVCNSIPVVIPPLGLQQTFAARIQVIEALKSSHRAALTALDSLFSSLQHRAFQGDL